MLIMSSKTWTSYIPYTKENHGLMIRKVYSNDGDDDDEDDDEGDQEQYDCKDDGDDGNDGDEFDDGNQADDVKV
jgi:hypothetical protein